MSLFIYLFLYALRQCSDFILLYVAVQFSQYHLLKRLPCEALPKFLIHGNIWLVWKVTEFGVVCYTVVDNWSTGTVISGTLELLLRAVTKTSNKA